MIEAVAEMDDELTHKYLEGEELTVAEIKRGLRLGTLTTRIIPSDRLGAQQQGRPEDARRGRRLPARRRSTSRR
jgi:translation elongation factor EF-G